MNDQAMIEAQSEPTFAGQERLPELVDRGQGAQKSQEAVEKRVTYELFILLVTLLSMAVALTRLLVPLNDEIDLVLQRIDGIYVIILLVDFVLRFVRAPHKLRYFFGMGIFDLLGSIPAVSLLRFLRLPRVVWQVRFLRDGSPKGVMHAIREQMAQSTLLTVAFVVLLVVMFGSMAIVGLEANDPNANITTGDDAIWWAIVTVATVGYGDRFPVTLGGRLIGTVMIVMGVSLFSVLTSYIASAFVARGETASDRELAAVRKELAEIKRLLADRPVDAAGTPASGGPTQGAVQAPNPVGH
ncbi:MAG: ion transporter [Caldilineaceae bacterium]